ncbi:MAG: ADP-forming succinate--CoA ligase subunit beta [Candidatus Caldarchaeum sp.]|nr:ADP-forming succinate--CoA ligase subunit beta [Candidatus Caldarchaeum sp.]MDW8435303.1 ADP-forming succinate--CoA ligase subunit beta [Candidatus Caldarchaeum sp.]
MVIPEVSVKLYEYEGRELFKRYGIPVNDYVVVRNVEEARKAADVLGGRTVVKAQVLVAGRGKAGGVKVAENGDEAAELAAKMLGSVLKGEKVESVLVTSYTEIESELYLGVIVDRFKRSPVVIASAEGGVEIEELARTSPRHVLKMEINPLIGLADHQVRRVLSFMKLSGDIAAQAGKILRGLYRLFVENDCELAEINPLAVTPDRKLVAVDAKIIIDENAVFRRPEFRRPESGSGLEAEAARLGFTAVELDGDIGIIGNGAGLTMATMDMVKLKGGSPANFLDVGGGAAEDVVDKAARLLLTHPKVKVLFVNILGGITRCDEVARGIVSAYRSVGGGKKIVVRMMGTNEEEGKRILLENGILPFDSMEEAAERAAALAR